MGKFRSQRTKPSRRRTILAGGSMIVSMLVSAQGSLSQQTPNQAFRIGINQVTLDVAVYDRHKRPVSNLKREDFKILENGLEQTIEAFGVSGANGSPVLSANGIANNPVETSTDRPNHGPAFTGYRFISIAIDDTSVESVNRDSVWKALNQYVSHRLRPDDLVAIYSLGSSLTLIQPFTNDVAKLKSAMIRAGKGQIATEAESSRAEAASAAERAGLTHGSGQAVQTQGSEQVAIGLADQASAEALYSFSALADYYSGQSLLRGLRAIADSQKNLVGAKQLILFSEGATLPASSGYSIDSVIASANAAGVSIDVIDAGGLSVAPPNQTFDPRGAGLPRKGRPDVYGGEDPTTVINGENGIERALKRITGEGQANRFGAVSRLANETGGMAITNDNDLWRSIQAIDDDALMHYTIAYNPKEQSFDGRYRKIEVSVRNTEYSVRTKSGYYAVKSEAVLSEEEPVRKLAYDLGGPVQNDFALQIAVPSFPRGSRAYLLPVMVRVPGSVVQISKEGGKYGIELAYALTVKDSSGAVVSTFGRDYSFDFSEQQGARVKDSEIPLRQNVRLSPGTYIIIAGVRDLKSGKTSIIKRGVTLAPSSDGPRISSLVLAHRFQQIADSQGARFANDVFAAGPNQLVIEPTDQDFKTSQPLFLFFRAYRGDGADHPLLVAAGFFKDGKLVKRTPTVRLAPPATAADSGFPVLTPFKLDDLEPGHYTVAVELVDEVTKNKYTKESSFNLEK